jgi:hypothetical protein
MSNKLDRRSFLSRVGATAGIGALAVITGTSIARAQFTDSDTGRNADRAGRGRGSVTDPGFRGQNCSDNDETGQYADPDGRGRISRTDSDADPSGQGRNCSDTDSN